MKRYLFPSYAISFVPRAIIVIVVLVTIGAFRADAGVAHAANGGYAPTYLLTRGVRIVALLHCKKTLRVKETTPCYPQSHFLH